MLRCWVPDGHNKNPLTGVSPQNLRTVVREKKSRLEAASALNTRDQASVFEAVFLAIVLKTFPSSFRLWSPLESGDKSTKARSDPFHERPGPAAFLGFGDQRPLQASQELHRGVSRSGARLPLLWLSRYGDSWTRAMKCAIFTDSLV